MTFLQAIKLGATILPILFDLIPAIERAYPLPKQGSEKLALLMQLLKDAVDVGKDGFSWDDVSPLVQRWTTAIVGFMNKTGSFSRG